MRKVLIILASFLLLLTGCNNSKVETIEETYIKELGYKVVSYEGELAKYTLKKSMLESRTENILYQQIWSLQEIKPEDYFGKEIITKKYIVKNHPLKEICKETLLYLMINEGKIIGGYSLPNNDSVGGLYSIDGKTVEEVTGLSYNEWQDSLKEKKGENDDRPQAKGFLFEAKKDSQIVYVAGTIHYSPNEYNLLNHKLLEVLKGIDAIYFELYTTELTDADKDFYYTDEPIENHLSEEEIIKLKNICEKYKIEYEEVKKVFPDNIVTYLETIIFEENNIGRGTEEALENYAKDKGIEILSLESIEVHTLTSKVRYGGYNDLKYILNNKEVQAFHIIKQIEKEFELYLESNDSDLYETNKKLSLNNPNDYNTIYKNRNQIFVDEILKFDKEKNYLVAVGYGHLYGPDNVLELLEKEGYTIKKISN